MCAPLTDGGEDGDGVHEGGGEGPDADAGVGARVAQPDVAHGLLLELPRQRHRAPLPRLAEEHVRVQRHVPQGLRRCRRWRKLSQLALFSTFLANKSAYGNFLENISHLFIVMHRRSVWR